MINRRRQSSEVRMEENFELVENFCQKFKEKKWNL